MKNENADRDADIAKVIGVDQATGYKKFRKRWLVIGVLVLVGMMAILFFRTAGNGDGVQYKTQVAGRGNLTVTVTATGNLEPTNEVDVGSELSGIIETVEVDYNDMVKVGQILARLDTDILESQVLQSKAALESTRARLLEAEATALEDHQELERLQRARELSGGKVPSQHDMDAAEAALKRAQAEVAVAKAQISETRAAFDINKTDLAKAVIRAPINGIVLSRDVDPGQTVAASFQAPVLFTLAEDLTQMELHVDVDEADVGQVKEGQQATFTVDAYADRIFPAHITQVRYGSQEVDGVITYETVLNVDNSDLSLRPGMTATADITVKKIENGILVPNAALRFTPTVQEEETSSGGGSLIGQLLPRRPRSASKQRKDTTTVKKQQRVWVLRDGQPVAIPLIVGLSDGIMTEVVGGEVESGMALVIDAIGVQQ